MCLGHTHCNRERRSAIINPAEIGEGSFLASTATTAYKAATAATSVADESYARAVVANDKIAVPDNLEQAAAGPDKIRQAETGPDKVNQERDGPDKIEQAMLGPHMPLLVEGKVTHHNEPCYGCHNYLARSMCFNDVTIVA